MSMFESLREKYCPPLDEPLFIALTTDYDLDDEAQRKKCESELDQLKASAIAEQEWELVTPVQETVPNHGGGLSDDNFVSITSGMSALTVSEAETNATDYQDLGNLPEGLENASSSDKERWLKGLFPKIESVQVRESLVRCHGDVHAAVDELLNLAFIHEDIDQNYTPAPIPRGIEGFVGEGHRKKGKKKRQRNHSGQSNEYVSDSGVSSGTATPNRANVWNKANDDVGFIVSRTSIPYQQVFSTYHQHNASMAQTLRALTMAEWRANNGTNHDNELVDLQAEDLKAYFEGKPITEKHIIGALYMCQMMPSAAQELLSAMIQTPDTAKSSSVNVSDLLDNAYAPVEIDEEESTVPVPARSVVPTDPGLLASQAGVHSARANRAFGQASAAYRRGKSDKLMGGVAAHYAQIGHEERRRQKMLASDAFDAHVYQQSSGNSIDLHGVTVEHAVRIARERVEQWWEGLGDSKYVVGGIGGGYRIITGVGSHSAQKIGKIGPAVSRMLIREGWKVNIQRGEIFVEGRVRKR